MNLVPQLLSQLSEWVSISVPMLVLSGIAVMIIVLTLLVIIFSDD